MSNGQSGIEWSYFLQKTRLFFYIHVRFYKQRSVTESPVEEEGLSLTGLQAQNKWPFLHQMKKHNNNMTGHHTRFESIWQIMSATRLKRTEDQFHFSSHIMSSCCKDKKQYIHQEGRGTPPEERWWYDTIHVVIYTVLIDTTPIHHRSQSHEEVLWSIINDDESGAQFC